MSVQAFNPRTGLAVGPPTPDTSIEDIPRIVDDAMSAGKVLAALSSHERAGWLGRLATDLLASSEQLVEVADLETGLGVPRLRGELARTVGQLELFADVLREGSYLAAAIDTHGGDNSTAVVIRSMRVPIGPVAVWSAGNFPFAFSVAGGDTASALAAGCAVIVKAHRDHPQLSESVAACMRKTLADFGAESAVTLVHGQQAGIRLLEDPRICAGAFTGSLSGGRALADRAASRPAPIPFYAEMGSSNVVVVSRRAAQARSTAIGEGLVQSFTLGSGQFCTKPGVIFLPRESAVLAVVAEAVNGIPSTPMLSARIRDLFVDGCARLIAHDGVTEFATSSNEVPEQGWWSRARVFRTDLATFIGDADTIGSENFGPSTVLVEYDDEADVAAALSQLPAGLTATVHAEDSEVSEQGPVDRWLETLTANSGRVVWNGWPTGVAVGWATHHGGPWPATSNALHTSVGAAAILRFLRPVAFQDFPEQALPIELRDANELQLPRRVDGAWTVA